MMPYHLWSSFVTNSGLARLNHNENYINIRELKQNGIATAEGKLAVEGVYHQWGNKKTKRAQRAWSYGLDTLLGG